jgi:hypothetical protein
MKKLVLILLFAVAGVALAGTAQAKEIVSLKICGASGCTTSTDRTALRGFEGEGNTDPEQVPVTNPQGYFTMEIGFGDENGNLIHRETAYWLPSQNLMRFRTQPLDPWWKLFPSQAALYHKLSGDLQPFTPTLSKVTVGGKRVADPTSYLRLMGSFPWHNFPRGKLHLTKIVLRTTAPNPWVEDNVRLSYDAKRRVLFRSDGYFRIPKALGARLMSRRSLSSSPASSDSGHSKTALYAGVGVGGVAALAALALVGRKKIH